MINAGIIGLGKISHRVAKGMLCAKNVELYAVASRNIDSAKAFQEEYHATKAYGSYEELLRDEKLQMVYICTPNHLHYEHIMKSLSYGKHVLCEKPLVATDDEIKECFAYAKEQHCFLMEAEKTLFTPLNTKIKLLLEDGAIGNIQYIEGSYGYELKESDVPKDFWGYRKENGGSAFDVGVYPICYANYFANAPLQTIQVMKTDTKQGYDVFMQALLEYDNGVKASVRSAWNMNMDNKGYIYGDEGYIVTGNFWKSKEATLVVEGSETNITVEMESDFCGEIEHAALCIESGFLQSPVMGEKQSLEIMKVLKQIKK